MKNSSRSSINTAVELVLLCICMNLVCAQEAPKPVIPIGLFIGRIEEGARIFTPVRLLPFDHPEAARHQFPNELQLYGTELDVLLWLGHQSGYELRATLTRYPKEPSPTWPYKEFAPPDTAQLSAVPCIRRPITDSPLKGLRSVLFARKQPACFIVDTRNLTLEERGMTKATTMGLDLTRSDFLRALSKAGAFVDDHATAAVIFGR